MSDATVLASPALGHEATALDFNRILVTNPQSTFVMRVDSNELAHRGIVADSYLVVDRSRKPERGKLVVFSYQGDVLCREFFESERTGACLVAKKGKRIPITDEVEIFGVVTRELRYL
jgi:DNA polymerase V